MPSFAKSRKKSRGKRALVVEDEAILAAMIEDTLRSSGFDHVTVAGSTEKALVLLREKLPDLVMLDVHLRDRDDGWAIAELLAELAPPRPQIIFSTGTPEDIPPNIAELGLVLAKPYAEDDLREAITHQPKGIFSKLRRNS